jgi:hypothetical protein
MLALMRLVWEPARSGSRSPGSIWRGPSARFAIPLNYTVVFPVIVGYPKGDQPAVARRAPEIVVWK